MDLLAPMCHDLNRQATTQSVKSRTVMGRLEAKASRATEFTRALVRARYRGSLTNS